MAKFGEADVAYVDSVEGEPAYDGESFRTLDSGLLVPQGAIGARPGRRVGNSLTLSLLGDGTTVRVGAGHVTMVDTAVTGRGGVYRAAFDQTKDFATGRPGAGTKRIDRFIARWNPTTKQGVVERIAGTAAASPDPAATQPPGGTIFEDLGYVTVPATGEGALTLTPATRYTGAAGAVIPMTTAERNALAASDLWDGRAVFDTTLGALLIRRGTRWLGEWQTYTPMWRNGTGGSVGTIGTNGLLTGRSQIDLSGQAVVTGVLFRGTGANVGATYWGIDLPIQPRDFRQVTGVAYVFDAQDSNPLGAAALRGVNDAAGLYQFVAYYNGAIIGHTNPVTELRWQLSYEAAAGA